MKKTLSVLLSLLMITTIFYSTSMFAGAANINPNVSFHDNQVRTLFEVKNYSAEGYSCTNLGGISVGAANNRLFCVKSNIEQQYGTLFYYDNIYDVGYKNGTKLPKRILFKNGLLGHANAMAVDDDYIYVTMWQKNGTQQSSILRISRKSISELPDKYKVSSTSATTSKGTVICKKIVAKHADGSNYNNAISSITRYTYNKEAGITKFIVGYYEKGITSKKRLAFTIATCDGNKLVVSEKKDDLFYVNYDTIYSALGDRLCYYSTTPNHQDIFYDSKYGLFIAMWLKSSDDLVPEYSTQNFIIRYDIRNLKKTGKSENLVFNPLQTISVNKDTNEPLGEVKNLYQFEIESLAFVKRDENKNDTTWKFILSCNKLKMVEDLQLASCDSIEELVGFSDKVPALT